MVLNTTNLESLRWVYLLQQGTRFFDVRVHKFYVGYSKGDIF